MKKEEQEILKQKYPKIAEKHSGINFIFLDKIIIFVKEHPRNNLGISVNDISQGINKKNSLIRKYCLEYAVPFGKLEIHKRGNSHQYPVAINILGEFKPIKNFNLELEESCSLIIDFLNQNPSKLPQEMRKHFNRLKESLASGRPNIGAEEKLITILWGEGIGVNCITFRRTNYLFC